MKRNTLFLLTFIALFYCSCYQRDSYYVPPPVYNTVSIGSSVMDGNAVVTFNDSQEAQIMIYVSLITNDPNDRVSCYFTGVQPPIIATCDTTSKSLPASIYGKFTINCDTGYYDMILNVNSRNKGLKQYPFKLHVLKVPDAADGLKGTYYGNDPCGHFSLGDVWYQYTSTVSAIPGYPHWISIKNFRGIGDTFYVNAMVSGTGYDGGVTIYPQTHGGYTIYGTGYYGPDTGPGGNEKPSFSVRDTIVHNGDTQTCILQLHQHPW